MKADKIGMGCAHNRVIHTTHEFPAQVNQPHIVAYINFDG